MIDTRLDSWPDADNFRKTVPSDPAARWDQDRGLMAQGHYTGLPGFVTEDVAVFEAMGTFQDRENENLVISDQFIVHARRKLLAAVKAFAASPALEPVDLSSVCAIAGLIPAERNWRDVEKPDLSTSVPDEAIA